MVAAPGPAHADVWWDRLGVAVEARVDRGVDDSAGLDLAVVGLGGELRLSPMVSVTATGVVVATAGVTDDGRRAHGAPGGELALALVPFPSWPVRPFARWSAGILAFPDQRFLPGGDVYDFMLHFGGGVDMLIDRRWRVAVHADYAHVSNGQGLGAFNPSFDGVGAGVDLAYALGAPRDVNDVTSATTSIERVHGASPEVVVDGTLGNVDGWYGVGRVRIADALTAHLVAQLDADAGTLASHPVEEAGVELIGTWQRITVGAHAGYQDYVGIHTGVAQLQAEAALTDATSFVMTGIWEPSSYVGAMRAGAGLRVAPLDSLVIDVGEGIDRALSAPPTTTYQPYFGAEWQLPIATSSCRWSVFYDRPITDVNEIGIRFAYSSSSTLRGSLHGPLWRRLE